MAKRFTSTEIWAEDWFLDIPIEYKLFWYYMLSHCNHAGLFKVNLGSFCRLNGVKLTSSSALTHFNTGKNRIRVINENLWLVEDFFVYQYGSSLNPKNRVHDSIKKEYDKHGIKLTSIRGLKDLTDGVKDKDKDKDKDIPIKDFKEEVRINGAHNDFVCYDVEEFLISDEMAFEKILIKSGRKKSEVDEVKKILHKYHLYMTKEGKYPVGKKTVAAGFEYWLLNEKKFDQNKTNANGTHQSHNGNSKYASTNKLVNEVAATFIARGGQTT